MASSENFIIPIRRPREFTWVTHRLRIFIYHMWIKKIGYNIFTILQTIEVTDKTVSMKSKKRGMKVFYSVHPRGQDNPKENNGGQITGEWYQWKGHHNVRNRWTVKIKSSKVIMTEMYPEGPNLWTLLTKKPDRSNGGWLIQYHKRLRWT